MDIRLITVKEDFEKAYNILNQKEYPLSFYEYALKHENWSHQEPGLRLIGVFEHGECIGTISYKISSCPYLEKILEIKEIYQKSFGGHKAMMDFLDTIAADENCRAIKICKNQAERLNQSIFDKMENFLKSLIQ